MPKTAPKPASATSHATFAEPWTWRTPLVTVDFRAGVPVDLGALATFGDIHTAAAEHASPDGV